MSNELIGNITTLFKTATMMFSGYCLGYLVSIGLNLPISQEQLSEIFMTILFFIAAYLDAKYPHTFDFLKGKKEVTVETEEDFINQEYYDEETEV